MYNEISSLDYHMFRIGLRFKYYIDSDNIWWYNYDDICEYLEITNHNNIERLYKNSINNEDKMECLDINNNYNEAKYARFISSNAVRYIVNRRNEKSYNLIKAIDNLEFAGDAVNLYCDSNELGERIGLLHDDIEDRNYQGIVYQSWCIVNSESGRDILDKMGVVNKDVLEFCDIIVDEFGNEFMDIDDIDFKFVVKREGSDEEREIKYKRAKERGNDFKAPAWLKELVK